MNLDSRIPTTLITGVSGYLGTKTANRLSKNGQHVIGLDLTRSPYLDPAVEFVRADILNLNEQQHIHFFQNADSVIHSAALVPLTRQYRDFHSVNVIGSRRVAEMAIHGEVLNFVHISSSAVYGANSLNRIDSDTELLPVEPYGQSKLEGERAVSDVLAKSGIRLGIVRPRTIIGPDRGGIFDLMFRWIQEGSPIFTIGKGDNLFQFIHVEDLIDFIILANEKKLDGTFNVGTNRFDSLNSMYFNLIEYANSKSRVVHLPASVSIPLLGMLEHIGVSPLAPWHYKTFHLPFHFDVSPLMELGWEPKYSNDEMFRSAYDSHHSGRREIADEVMSPHTKRLEGRALTAIGRALSSFGESSQQFRRRVDQKRS
jgi:nucleoside-diphosphate-sugar epimerase